MRTFRDLTLVAVGTDEMLVIACDSLGGIGPKADDTVRTTAEVVGRFIVRVPLMEVLAAGAKPTVVVNTLSVEMEPTGKGILQGMQQELKAAGLAQELMVTGSTEENVPTCQTGVGVTVIGKARQNHLRLGHAQKGDALVCVGRPKVGAEVLSDEAVADIPLLQKLLQLEGVHEILPVGSKGVLFEANQLAAGASATLNLQVDKELDLAKSAGPATCLLVAIDEGQIKSLSAQTDLPLFRVGWLKE